MRRDRESEVVVGVDVGGTKILAATVANDGALGPRVEVPMPGRDVPERALEDALDRAVHDAADGRRLRAVGVSAAGFVDASGQRVVFAPHLPWRDAPVRARLEDRWQVPVALENDATCALVSEHQWGAARGRDSVLLVTVGTGIGGGLLVHGRPVRGSSGMAGEYGHMTVVPRGRACECGGAGCWEQYCSGRALARAAVDDRSDVDPREVGHGSGPTITAAARAGDPAARAAFATVGGWLGAGLANLVAAIDPEIVVIGGGVSRAGELLLAPARAELARRLVGGTHRTPPELVIATTGVEAGLRGAACLAHRVCLDA